jgi:hypothetical protein
VVTEGRLSSGCLVTEQSGVCHESGVRPLLDEDAFQSGPHLGRFFLHVFNMSVLRVFHVEKDQARGCISILKPVLKSRVTIRRSGDGAFDMKPEFLGHKEGLHLDSPGMVIVFTKFGGEDIRGGGTSGRVGGHSVEIRLLIVVVD